jgi:glycosyltransferase involved in cell wall biosynthesis
MKKILYHHRTASRDGQSTHIEEMIRGLRGIGCTVEEAAPAVGGDDASGGSPGWVGRAKKWLPRPFYELAEIAYSWAAYRRLARRIRISRPDAIYERYNLYLLAGVWARRRFGIPLVLEVNAPMAVERRKYGGLTWPRLADFLEHYVWRAADAVLPVSHMLARHMIEHGVDPVRIRVIPNGANEEYYRALPTVDSAKRDLGLDGRFVIGFIGFVREWDQLDRIVRWIARNNAQRPEAHLLIVGDGPARTDIERCAHELGVSAQVTFTGTVSRARVPQLAMAFDIALQTALVPYASPICLFEYLALSKAMVAPDQPNHHEILADRENALMYDPNDDAGIERALDTLCADSALRQRIAAGAGKVIREKRLTWQQHAATVVDVISGIAVRKHSTSSQDGQLTKRS